MKRLGWTGIFLWLGLGAHTAEAQAQRCLTHAEVETLALTIMPDVLEALAKRCAPVLPPGTTLRAGLPSLLERMRTDERADQQAAAAAFGKIMGDKLRGIDPATMMPIVKGVIDSELTKGMKDAECGRYDRFVGLIAPLPPRNTAGLVVMLFEIGTAKDRRPPFRICPVTAP